MKKTALALAAAAALPSARCSGLRRSVVLLPTAVPIFRLAQRRPDLSVRGLQRALAAEGAVFAASTLHRFLKRHGLQRRRRLSWRRNPAPGTAGG